MPSIPGFLLTPSPRQPLMYFLSLCICPFWTFHMNGIVHYVVLCDWHSPSSAFKVCSCCSMDLYFIPFYSYIMFHYTDTPYCIYLSVNGNVGCFHLWLVRIVLLWTFMYKFLCGCTFSFLLVIYLGMGMELLESCGSLCLTIWETARLFPFDSPTRQYMSIPISPHPCQSF